MTQTLEQLSAAATQGEWRVTTPPEDWETGGVWVGTNPYEYASNVVGASCCCCGTGGFWDQDDANFAVALVNAYRTGQLVEGQADDATVDRVARAICKARYLNGGDTSDDGWVECQPRLQDDYREQATAAIAAMKGPKL